MRYLGVPVVESQGGVVHDVSNRWTRDRIHKDVLAMLETASDIPSFLIMNKVDQVKSKHQILLLIHSLCNGFISGKRIPGPKRGSKTVKDKEQKGYSKFSDVFIVSALKGDGVLDIKNYLANNAKPASLYYSSTVLTDQEPEEIIKQAVRAKFMDYLAQEIPYNLKIKMEYFDDSTDDKVMCSVEVECPSERLVKLISGAGGGRLQQIKSDVRNDLIDVFGKSVQIDLNLIPKRQPKD
ncbi:GTPase Era, mitochondrial [Eumeta japonica]|uniref:GTPase Era, mitochondrial n=1 Tax=Eumeta variegata TaxID=151549 RepID=A0A4C1UH70_EUMVA|nr:GTPase Era, mitochondrial [Eumeta japonica]